MSGEALFDRTVREVSAGAVYELLPAEVQRAIGALTPAELEAEVRRLISRPIPGETSPASRLLLNPVLAVQWMETFAHLGVPRNLRVYEPCTGSSEPILLAADVYSGGAGEYLSLNLNRPLAGELHAKVGKIRLSQRFIEEDATQIDRPELAGTFDAACFHHAINDLLQTAVAESRGLDTRELDWWKAERQMIEWLAEEAAAGSIEGGPRDAVLAAIRGALRLLKPGGVLLVDHWTWEAYRETAWFPWPLFQSLIPLVRRWVARAELPVTEIHSTAHDTQWWLLYRKA